MRWSWWSPRMVISWLDRDPWVGVGFAVPLTIVVLGALAGHPFLFVFVPLLLLAVLAGVAFVVMDLYKGQKREPEHQAQVGAGPQQPNHQSCAETNPSRLKPCRPARQNPAAARTRTGMGARQMRPGG